MANNFVNEAERKANHLIFLIQKMGYPKEFGVLIAQELKTEKQISRMIGYLYQSKHVSMEEIADEMLAIKEDFASYQRKHIREYNNAQYNMMLAKGLNKKAGDN